MKILNFGSCNIDHVYSLDHIVGIGETENTYKLEIFPGGKGLNQSIAVAKAGAEIYHAGCLGCDCEILIDILRDNGVDISYMKKTTEKNGHAVIQVSAEGDNSILIYPGSNELVNKEYIDEVLEKFGFGDIILLQNEISNVDYIVQKAYEKQMCIILNPSPINEKIDKIDFNKLDYIILNEVEIRAISNCEDIEEGLKFVKNKYPNLKIMLTLGKRGSIYVSGTSEIRQPAFKVNVVDTTAAGDTFTGYFVAELSKGNSFHEILKIASTAAAIAVSKMGAAPSIPDKNEVITSIENFEHNDTQNKADVLRKQINSYIDINIKQANLEELSKALGYNTVYTGSLVKKLTGKSFSKLLQSKRCSVAAKQLISTDLSISEIITDIGYENESFFRKIFKEKYGKNPLEFRRINSNVN